MLPLQLYFSDEYKLLTAAQLLTGVQQATLCDDRLLLEGMQKLGFLQATDLPKESLTAIKDGKLPRFTPPAPTPAILTLEQANRQFNIYLKQIDTLAEHHSDGEPGYLTVDPFTLHPACSPLSGGTVIDMLTRKLVALAQIAEDHALILELAQPTEEQLESWLQILELLMQEPALRHIPVAICLSATSKRLLPTLGYLERLCRDRTLQLRIRLTEHPYRTGASWPFAYTTPVLEHPLAIAMHFATACAFLASANNQHLLPELILHSRGLLELTQPLTGNRWRIRLQEANPPTRPNDNNGPEGPCLLPGLAPVSHQIHETLHQLNQTAKRAVPIIGGQRSPENAEKIRYRPAEIDLPAGNVVPASEHQVRQAFAVCSEAQRAWGELSLYERRDIIQTFANTLAAEQVELALLCAQETGIPLNDCLQEIQEALRLIHCHLQQAVDVMATQPLPSRGDSTCMHPLPRGTLLGLLPWNQPLAPFATIASAVLLTGNALLIRPACPAALTATRLFDLLLNAGVPGDLIALLPGDMDAIGSHLLDDYRLEGVLFNGTPVAANTVQQYMARRVGAPPLPFLTDTGGRHAVIVDRDSDPEVLLPVLLRAALARNGQHPAALRVLYVEEGIAEQMEELLTQALQWVHMGAPEARQTELGPLISREQMDRTYLHIERFRSKGRVVAQPVLPAEWHESYFVPPTLLRLYSLDELQEAIEAPVIHLIRFDREQIDRTIDEINRSGFAMALTLYSGDSELTERLGREARVSELNLNPSQLYPVSGYCPGSGSGLSGTAARPGTADYLKALVRYQIVTRDEGCRNTLFN